MIRTDCLSHGSSHGPAAGLNSLAALARRAWGSYWDRQARKATALILHSVDQRTLKDIGVDRSEIESFAYNPGCDRRRCYTPGWQGQTR
ncbi:MAG: hypothetical protein AB7K67_04305 [Hyphomicrobiaceae bacterium]